MTLHSSRSAGLAAVLFLAFPPTAIAGHVGDTASAANLFSSAITELSDGKNYDDAIIKLTHAVTLSPDKADYRLALGCACADRAASLNHAASFTEGLPEMRSDYLKSLAAWIPAQFDPKNDDYHSARPVLPPAWFRTKDDGLPYHLTKAQVLPKIDVLGARALAEWRLAITLSKTPEERARAGYIDGWGIRLLKDVKDNGIKGIVIAVKPHEETDAFAVAAKTVPTNALYWQTLGDSYTEAWSSIWMLFGDAVLHAGSQDADTRKIKAKWDAMKADDQAKATTAYRHALALDPRNALYWYHLYTNDNGIGMSLSARATRPATAISALKQAAAADPANAFPDYLLAVNAVLDSHLDASSMIPTRNPSPEQIRKALTAESQPSAQAAGKEALAVVETGNRAKAFHAYRYELPPPAWIVSAWGYDKLARSAMFTSFPTYSQFRELGRCLCGYAGAAAYRKDYALAARAANATIAMGMKTAGKWPVSDSGPETGEVIQTLVSIAVASIGYHELQKVYAASDDIIRLAATNRRYDSFQQRRKRYAIAVRAHLNSNYFDYY